MHSSEKSIHLGDLTAIRLAELQDKVDMVTERARTIRSYASWMIPGLLQTRDYAATVLRMVNRRSGHDDDISAALESRMRRQRVLGDNEHICHFLIEEWVLYSNIGGAHLMEPQIDRIIEIGESAGISLGIIPMTLDRTLFPNEEFWVYDDEVHIELHTRKLTFNGSDDVSGYLQAFDDLTRQARFGAEARTLLEAARCWRRPTSVISTPRQS